jgi:hypothetical protein
LRIDEEVVDAAKCHELLIIQAQRPTKRKGRTGGFACPERAREAERTGRVFRRVAHGPAGHQTE